MNRLILFLTIIGMVLLNACVQPVPVPAGQAPLEPRLTAAATTIAAAEPLVAGFTPQPTQPVAPSPEVPATPETPTPPPQIPTPPPGPQPIIPQNAISITQVKSRRGRDVTEIAIAPDGATLAAGSSEGVWLYRLPDLAAPRLLSTEANVGSVAFSPDGTTLASGSWDNTIRLWNVADGSEIMTLTGYTDAVSSVAFSPDGTTLASGSDDGIIRLWALL